MPGRRTGRRTPRATSTLLPDAETYIHTEEQLIRPDVGVQAQFRKRKPPKTYRFDPTLDPELAWNEAPVDKLVEELWDRAVNAATLEEARDALRQLDQIARPSLRWAGKAERPEMTVPTLPLFVHERLSTQGIIESLRGHKRDKQLALEMFGDPQLPIADRALKAYEHKDRWVNRLILGDSLQVMNSLLEYESLGGQVQMIYMDPPYGVKFRSNFQPFIRRRQVSDSDDADLPREPEMVQAYRDAWSLSGHSYLTYVRDRLVLCRELLSRTGSLFFQIGEETLNAAIGVLSEVFGGENIVRIIPFRKKTMPLGANYIEQMSDFIVWVAKDKQVVRWRPLFKWTEATPDANYRFIELQDGTRRELNEQERKGLQKLPAGARLYRTKSLEPSGVNPSGRFRPVYQGVEYDYPPKGYGTNQEGMARLIQMRRVQPVGRYLNYVLFFDDYPVSALTVPWDDTVGSRDPTYVVQTHPDVVRRCMQLTTDPGDLVLDPTCGSGTTGYIAEQWGRRWITVDVSRVPLALARQRLLTATYPYYKLREPADGLAAGFSYCDRDHTGNARTDGFGIVPHLTLEDIAENRDGKTEVLVDRPEIDYSITRVSGPFVVEATIPTPLDLLDAAGEDGAAPAAPAGDAADFLARMLETLRKAPRIALGGNQYAALEEIRQPARSLTLAAEARLDGQPVAIVFGPENGAVNERLVAEAAREAYQKGFTRLFVFGFAIEPNARLFVDRCEQVSGVAAAYVAVTPDVAMGDLLKNQRSSQVFSVAGLPDIRLLKEPDGRYRVELRGLDTFDPATMEARGLAGDDVPAWFLDTNYDEYGAFCVDQAFFPRTGAWDALRKDLRGAFDDTVWDALSGTLSEPFEPGDRRSVAVKVIDERGNELIAVRSLDEAEPR